MATRPPRPELSEARERGFHNTGEASGQTQVSAKMIRHYERIGLIPPAARTFANYRLYSDADSATIVEAHELGLGNPSPSPVL